MGNKTNDRNWAATERLRFIEACAWWKGIVNQQDLVGLFGVSMAQASSDLQRYLEMNPAAFVYDSRQKRYEATTGVRESSAASAAGPVPLRWMRMRWLRPET
jgi:hypothetical protein